MIQALLLKKLSIYDQIVIKTLKRRREEYQTNFYMNFDQKMIYEWNSTITSFALYDLYHTNTAHEQ